jgi:hypothetical protein
MALELQLTLLSDATFGRGDGLAGLVDAEVEQDTDGMPFLAGRTLKGLLVEECANLFHALTIMAPPPPSALTSLEQAAAFLFGKAGSALADDAKMQVGDARLPHGLREAIVADVQAGNLTPIEVLESLTAIRRQSAMTADGAPARDSLRSLRVVLHNTSLVAPLSFNHPPDAVTRILLAACIAALRRAGTGRNRGRGRLSARLWKVNGANVKDLTDTLLDSFKTYLTGGRP